MFQPLIRQVHTDYHLTEVVSSGDEKMEENIIGKPRPINKYLKD